MDFNDYQRNAVKTRQEPILDSTQHLTVSLLGLAGEAGELISEYKKHLRDGQNYTPLQERMREELGDILWYVASVADEFGFTLDEIAASNLQKIDDRWIKTAVDPFPAFDQDFPRHEQLPRRFRVKFEEVIKNGQKAAQMTIEGDGLGDPLTDNAHEEDGYRFHDVFHWACAAMIGWSPVLRKLLHRKRKSNKRVDEVEDGARAAAIEEGISALVFSYAADRHYLVGAKRIDSILLRTIKGMTRNLEPNISTLGAWEKTIFATFEVWRHLNDNDGGVIVVDLDERRISIGE